MPARKKGTKPVRDVAKRANRGRKAYIVPTERNANGFVAGESFLERNHLLLLSLQVGLKRVSDQAVCIDLENETLVASRDDLPKKGGKKAASYTADSEYERDDGQVGVCESKPSAFLEKNAEKHALAEKILSKYGKPFITLTEQGFTPVFISNLENLKKALSSAQQQHAAEAGLKISRALLQKDRWLTHELKQWAELSSADIFFGLAYGVLRADLRQPLFSDTACVEAANGLDVNVSRLDFKRLKHKYTESSEAEMSAAEWDFAEQEYRRFLTLKCFYPSVALVPSKMVDTIWHAHILDTRAYREDCQQVFDRFIDHYPYFGIYGKDDYQELKSAFAQTVALYEKHFGEYPGGGSEAQAMRCKDHACHVESKCACRVEGACKDDVAAY